MDSHQTKTLIHRVFAGLAAEVGFGAPRDEVAASGVYVTYVGDRSGIRISFELYDGGIFVMVFPLKDGQIPPYSNWYDIVDLLAAQDIDFEEIPTSGLHDPSAAELQRTLEHFRTYVRLYGKEFLAGDFHLCAKMDEIIATRKERLLR